jgi:hypothetical protein
MRRISSLAAVAAILGYTGLALAQQPTYSPTYQDRYANRPTTGSTVMPAERQSWSPWRQTTSRETMGRDTIAPARQRTTMNADQFSTEGDARAHCGGDTVVWVNTKSHVYHFAGNKSYRPDQARRVHVPRRRGSCRDIPGRQARIEDARPPDRPDGHRPDWHRPDWHRPGDVSLFRFQHQSVLSEQRNRAVSAARPLS